MENLKFYSSNVTISESEQDPEVLIAKFIISDFSVNKNNVQLNRDTIEDWVATLKDKPLVGKIKNTLLSADFTGHNAKKVKKKDENGKEYEDIEFDTFAYGTFTSVDIESIDDHEYIVAECKIWKRFAEACSIIQKRAEEGTLHTSWEISVLKHHTDKKSKAKVIDEGCFLAHTLLGANTEPAYDCSGLLQVASVNEEDDELSNALLKDLTSQTSELSIDENSKREVNKLENENLEQNVDNKDINVASLTIDDIFAQLTKLICEIKEGHWSHIAYLYPEDHKAICRDYYAESEQDFFEVSYEIVEDKAVQLVGEPIEKKLSFVDVSSIKEKEDTIVSLENEKETLSTQVTELSTKLSTIEEDANKKNEALVKANENNVDLSSQIETLNKEISELNVYKEQVEKINAEKQEQEIAEKKEALKGLALKSKLITEEEIETSEIVKPLIEELNEQGIKNLIAERYIASMNEKQNVETSQVKPQQEKIDLASKDTFDGESLIRKYIAK